MCPQWIYLKFTALQYFHHMFITMPLTFMCLYFNCPDRSKLMKHSFCIFLTLCTNHGVLECSREILWRHYALKIKRVIPERLCEKVPAVCNNQRHEDVPGRVAYLNQEIIWISKVDSCYEVPDWQKKASAFILQFLVWRLNVHKQYFGKVPLDTCNNTEQNEMWKRKTRRNKKRWSLTWVNKALCHGRLDIFHGSTN